jgi:acetyl-CoA carboxylase biotin carboxylase subunit
MFRKVLIANRGAVAARVIRALDALKVPSVAVYSEADAGAPYLAAAGESYCIGPAPARESYLNAPAILDVLRRSGADAVHPGYGFLSEDPGFAAAVTEAGACFIGPSPRFIEAMGHKTRARALAERHGLPVGVGSPVLDAEADALAAARAIGFPVLVKPAAGGGGIGMLPARSEAELAGAVDRARSMALRGFGNSEIYLERLFDRPRHIEFQVLCDRHGAARVLFERDCSPQRRHQKILEEAPAPGLPRDEIAAMGARIGAMLRTIGYDNIGTVEMLRGNDGSYSFLEMNTRLQVEHGVTEAVTGIDLVAAQIRLAAGERLDAVLPAEPSLEGHAIEARVYAEDPRRFFPSPGRLVRFRPPRGVRVETGYAEGREVTPHYDPLLAKVIVHEATRAAAIRALAAALEAFAIEGVKTNIPALLAILRADSFASGRGLHTGLVGEVIAE